MRSLTKRKAEQTVWNMAALKEDRFNLVCVYYRVKAEHFIGIILLVLSVQFGHLVGQQQEHNPAK